MMMMMWWWCAGRMASVRVLGLPAILALGCGQDGGQGDGQDKSREHDPDAGPVDSAHARVGPVGDGDADPNDLSVALFDPEHLIEVEVELDPADWEALSHEGRHLPDVMSGCGRDYEYTYFTGTVTVDGESYENVAVRKKGFLGSLSTLRPSLKLNFGKFVEGRTHANMKRMTLNNNHSDPSNARQCMAYGLFRAAGAIAPRCNFAHVTVNGNDLGIYTHVESVKKPMLRRHFADDGGNLYEGQAADFIAKRVDLMELKTNKLENDRSDLAAVLAALEVDDADLLDALAKVIDVDAFLTFWALEVLVGHWDSYSGGRNNYLTYHDPTTGHFFFIPWGTDGAFSQTRVFSRENRTVSVLAEGRIASRLYAHAQGRAMYFERLSELFDQLWDESALLVEVDRIERLTSPPPGAIRAHRTFISSHATAMRAALAASDEAPDWIDNPNPNADLMCRPDALTPVSGTFSTTWDSLMAPSLVAAPVEAVQLTLNGQPWQPSVLFAGAGPARNDPSVAQVLLFEQQPNGRLLALLLRIPSAYFIEGERPMHAFETNVMLLDLAPGSNTDVHIVGFGGGGSVTLDTASKRAGGAVKGHFDAEFIQIIPF